MNNQDMTSTEKNNKNVDNIIHFAFGIMLMCICIIYDNGIAAKIFFNNLDNENCFNSEFCMKFTYSKSTNPVLFVYSPSNLIRPL